MFSQTHLFLHPVVLPKWEAGIIRQRPAILTKTHGRMGRHFAASLSESAWLHLRFIKPKALLATGWSVEEGGQDGHEHSL